MPHQALPPLLHQPGDKVTQPYLPQQSGKFLPWNLHREGFVVADTHATPAELKALEASLQRIAAVVKKAPLFNPPMGFDVYSSSTLYSHEATVDMKRALATNEPLMTDIFFSELGKFEMRVRSKSTGEVSTRVATEQEVECGLRFHVNTYPRVGVRYEDAEGMFFLEPRKSGEIGGLPVYEDMLVIARPDDTLWVPVTRERILKWLLPNYKSDLEYAQKAEAESLKNRAKDLSPEQIAKWRQEEAAARAKGGAGAEQEACHLEAMHRRWEEDSRKALESAAKDSKVPARQQIYKDAQAMLADPASHTAPACIIVGDIPGATNGWQVVPAGTPGCRLVVRSNSALFNPKLPRSALQVIHVDQITESTKYLESEKHLREDPGNCVAVSKLIRQLNWQELVALLEK